jgi:hypothetical protein
MVRGTAVAVGVANGVAVGVTVGISVGWIIGVAVCAVVGLGDAVCAGCGRVGTAVDQVVTLPSQQATERSAGQLKAVIISIKGLLMRLRILIIP